MKPKPAPPKPPVEPKKSVWAKLKDGVGTALGEWFGNR